MEVERSTRRRMQEAIDAKEEGKELEPEEVAILTETWELPERMELWLEEARKDDLVDQYVYRRPVGLCRASREEQQRIGEEGVHGL
jgi:hypothetical protein